MPTVAVVMAHGDADGKVYINAHEQQQKDGKVYITLDEKRHDLLDLLEKLVEKNPFIKVLPTHPSSPPASPILCVSD